MSRALGSECSSGTECASRKCQHNICVPGDSKSEHTCAHSDECISGYCRNGRCATGSRDGTMGCTTPDQCASRNCVSAACAPESRRPFGEPCLDNHNCASDHCINGHCKHGNGAQCNENPECASGFCTGVCINPTTHKQGLGYPCYAEFSCVSHHCSAHSEGGQIREGKCLQGIKPANASCTYGIECASSTCADNRCAEEASFWSSYGWVIGIAALIFLLAIGIFIYQRRKASADKSSADKV